MLWDAPAGNLRRTIQRPVAFAGIPTLVPVGGPAAILAATVPLLETLALLIIPVDVDVATVAVAGNPAVPAPLPTLGVAAT